jgi:hypothetical protein
VAVVATVWSALAYAAPGELAPRAAGEGEPLEIVEKSERACARAGAVCWWSAGRSTIAVESQAVASAPDGKASVAAAAPRFARAASANPLGGWMLEIAATLKRPVLAGNVVFLFFDTDDKEALQARQFTALFQASAKAGKSLAAKLALHSDDGFHAGRTYRLRIVQLVGGRELLLAEGDVTLL